MTLGRKYGEIKKPFKGGIFNSSLVVLSMTDFNIQDCSDKIPDLFELVMLATERSKQLNSGSPSRTAKIGPTAEVTALNEIAEGKVSYNELMEYAINNFRNKALIELHDETIDQDLLDNPAYDSVYAAGDNQATYTNADYEGKDGDYEDGYEDASSDDEDEEGEDSSDDDEDEDEEDEDVDLDEDNEED